MAQYNLVVMARDYYTAYIRRDLTWSVRRDAASVEVEREFDDLEYSERACIKEGLRGALLVMDPEATFIGGEYNAEHRAEFQVSGAPDKE